MPHLSGSFCKVVSWILPSFQLPKWSKVHKKAPLAAGLSDMDIETSVFFFHLMDHLDGALDAELFDAVK